MPSLRHRAGRDAHLLDAARHCILDVGWKRTTLTDVARRADVSRMTIYRRWPDMQTLLADLMTREWSAVMADATSKDETASNPLDEVATGVVRAVAALRDNPLFRRILEVDPELLLPYLLDRRGRTQDAVLEQFMTAISEAQRAGSARKGDPVTLARAVLLAAQGFTLSAHTMTSHDPSGSPTSTDLDAELRLLIQNYLAR